MRRAPSGDQAGIAVTSAGPAAHRNRLAAGELLDHEPALGRCDAAVRDQLAVRRDRGVGLEPWFERHRRSLAEHRDLAGHDAWTSSSATATSMRAPERAGSTQRSIDGCSSGRHRLGLRRGHAAARRELLLELGDQLVGALPAVGRTLGQALHDDGAERRRDRGRREVIGSGCWVTCAASTSCGHWPVNGGVPVSSS